MTGSVITTTGVPAATERLHETGRRATHLTKVMEAEAKWAQRKTTGVPEDTGRLARSVAGGPDELHRSWDEGYLIGSLVPYSAFVFGGTSSMDARPPKPPADAAEHAARAIAADLERAA